MTAQAHTPGRLVIERMGDKGGVWFHDENHKSIFDSTEAESWPLSDEDARRLAAAWNACERIPTESLEAGVVAELIDALQQIDLAPLAHGDDAIEVIQQLARAALAKVRGETT